MSVRRHLAPQQRHRDAAPSSVALLEAEAGDAPPCDSAWEPIDQHARTFGRVLVGWAGHPDAWTVARFGPDAEGVWPCWRDGNGNPLTPPPTHYRLVRGPA
jgi:hypothetical protein